MDTVKVELRDPGAKGRQLRRAGIVPGVIFGAGLEESLAVQMPALTAGKLRRSKRVGSLVEVQVGEKRYQTMIKELDYRSLTDEIVHISFQSLEKGKKTRGVADIVLLNKDKVQGFLEQIQMKAEHRAAPEYLLDTVTVDLENRPIGTVIRVKDIPELQNENIELQTDPESIVLRISEKKSAADRLLELLADEPPAE